MDKAERKKEVSVLLTKPVMEHLRSAIPGFDRAGLLSAIIDSFGGQEHLGKAIFLEYEHAPRGSMIRQRILDMICRMISQHSSTEASKPVEEMDEEELRSQILSIMPDLEKIGVTPKETKA